MACYFVVHVYCTKKWHVTSILVTGRYSSDNATPVGCSRVQDGFVCCLCMYLVNGLSGFGYFRFLSPQPPRSPPRTTCLFCLPFSPSGTLDPFILFLPLYMQGAPRASHPPRGLYPVEDPPTPAPPVRLSPSTVIPVHQVQKLPRRTPKTYVARGKARTRNTVGEGGDSVQHDEIAIVRSYMTWHQEIKT